MPLIVLSGYPCSGKSTRAGELKAYFDGIDGITEVVIVSDNFFDADKNKVYSGLISYERAHIQLCLLIFGLY